MKSCKEGKTPTGKNGRCVKAKKAKTCKAGKTPTGKNGRCVKAIKTRAKRNRTIKQKGTVTPTRESDVKKIIQDYMIELDDPEFFTQKEVNQFVAISVRENLSKGKILEGLDNYSKGFGIFSH